MRPSSPVVALVRVLFNAQSWRGELASRQKDFLRPHFKTSELLQLQDLGILLNVKSDFPFIKDKIYYSALPISISKQMQKLHLFNAPRPKVILLFTEGMSARSLGVYGASYPGLTPNLAQFSKRSIVVENYFNHTAATNPGLKGQLCSNFPSAESKAKIVVGGTNMDELIEYYCLPKILNEAGYQSIFLNAHITGDTPIERIMRQIDFLRSSPRLASKVKCSRCYFDFSGSYFGTLSWINRPNAFSGTSLFDDLPTRGTEQAVAAYSSTHLLVDREKVYSNILKGPEQPSLLRLAGEVIEYSKQLELHSQLWSSKASSH